MLALAEPLAKMEVVPTPRPDASPYTAHCRYYYTSAPTSPSRDAACYADVYATWDHKPTSTESSDEASDFSFCSYGIHSQGEWPMPSLATADELFEEGMIRPLIQPVRREAATRDRGRAIASSAGDASFRGRRASRSLSPLRGGGVEGEFPIKALIPSSASPLESGGNRKWRLKDLFLFRSASEGRAAGRGRSVALCGHSVLPSSSPPSSANLASVHEMYYSANRAAAEEMKRKTPLPYQRPGLFGCLRFNPSIDGIKKGFGGSLFSRK